MKLFETAQIKDIDQYTIENEPISSSDLMERAGTRMTKRIMSSFNVNVPFWIISGPGNNGGDGLVIARLLLKGGYNVTVCMLRFTDKISEDCQLNLDRYNATGGKIIDIKSAEDVPEIPENAVIIDAVFGAGLTRPVKGLPGEVIAKINQIKARKVAIDIPSGLFGEDNSTNTGEIFKADDTLTVQFPKRSFFFKENRKYTGEVHVIDIGLHPEAIAQTPSTWYINTESDIKKCVRKRDIFDHKGHFGHALLIAGSYGKMGAAVLAANACLRAGVGLLTVHIPKTGYQILQQAVPEAMLSIDDSDLIFTGCHDTQKFNAYGVGPGLDKKPNTKKALADLIQHTDKPMVLDADALNIIAENKSLLNELPANTVLTPHPKEFERLFGKSKYTWAEAELQLKMAVKYKLVIIVKGAFTRIATPEGTLYINITGNPGMATAGAGDVLTGIVLSLLAQGYDAGTASRLAVFVHGKAGDAFVEDNSQEALIAGDIPVYLGKIFKKLKQ
ncbi:MAG: NAD(P)H-hydrate dehydratase [Bacteroidales bacterium]